MALTIQERLKDLRVERGLTLEQLAEQTNLSKSALGSYEADDFKDISHYALIKLARFYGVTTDYLLLIAAHIDDDSFCRYIIQQDINGIALDLRENHRGDFFSVPEDNPLKGLLQAADEAASLDGDPEKVSLVFICKRLRLNYGKLSGEDKAALKRLAGKSDLLKNPIPQRRRK